MPDAVTQTAVLASSTEGDLESVLWAIDEQARALGGVTIDCRTQMPLDPASVPAAH
jgi:hypothetical protein